MPLQSLTANPPTATLNSVYVSLRRFIALQEQNNDYLEGLTLVSGLSTSDAGFALVVDPTGASTALEAVDQRTRIRLQDVLGLSSSQTAATDADISALLGSTGAGTFTLTGKTGAAAAATATITHTGTPVAATGSITVTTDAAGTDSVAASASITVDDGTNTPIVFDFVSSYTGSNPKISSTSYEILIETGDDTKEEVAEAIQYSLNYADTSGDLDITSTWSGGTDTVVSLVNQAAGSKGNETITTSSTVGITVSGMASGASVGPDYHNKTLILNDAGSQSHILTYSTASSTSSTIIGVEGSTIITAEDVAEQVKDAINAAETAGDIDITATYSGSVVTLTMTATGSAGNGDQITGTAEGSALITTTSFTGGTAGDLFKCVVDGDQGVSAGFSIQKADFVSLEGTSSITLTSESGTISLDNATIGSLVYPASDGSADQVITTDGSGTLSFTDKHRFSETTYNYSHTGYTGSYTTDNPRRITLTEEASGASNKKPGYSFANKGADSGLGAHIDSSSKGHNLFIKFGNDEMVRITRVSVGDILHLGNDTTEGTAGNYVYVKPSIVSGGLSSSGSADIEGAIFYDNSSSSMRFYTDSSLEEFATTADIANKLGAADGATTGELALNNTNRAVTDLDLRFSGATGITGLYAKTASSLGTGTAVGFGYNSLDVLEISGEGLHAASASSAAPFINYRTATGEGTTETKPSYAFTNDVDTGMYLSSTGTLSFTTAGSRRGSVSNSGWDFNNLALYNIATPTAGQNSYAVPKSYVDGIIDKGTTLSAALKYNPTSGKWVEDPNVRLIEASGFNWLTVGATSGQSTPSTGILTFYSSAHVYNTSFQASASQAASLSFKWPAADGADKSILSTDGSGNLSFQTIGTLGDTRYLQSGSAVFTSTAQMTAGTQQSPAFTYGSGTTGTYQSTGQGYASLTFDDTEFDDYNNETITIIDTAGTSQVYLIKNDGTAAAGSQEFNAGASASAAATNLVTLINGSDGHNGTIIATATDERVEFTQSVAGVAGNTTIARSTNWDTLCSIPAASAFSGGNTYESLIYQLSAYNRIAQFTDAPCSGISRASVQGFADTTGRMITEARTDTGPMFTFVGKEDTGIGYRETAAVAATGTITVIENTDGDNLDTETIVLNDGTNTVTFTFALVYGTSGNPKDSATAYTIKIGDVDNDEDIASRVQYSIDYADTQGDLDITAVWSGGTSTIVTLTNQAAGVAGNQTITTTSPTSRITVSGLANGVGIINTLTLHAGGNTTPMVEVNSENIIILDTVKIQGVADPLASTDAANKLYVDTQMSSIVAPTASGSAAGEIPTYTGSGNSTFQTDLIYTSNELRVGDTGGTVDSASLKLSTKYSFVEIAAPLATASSGAGYVTPYTLTLPIAAGSARDVMVTSNSTGGLTFQKRGAYTSQARFIVTTLSSDPSWHGYRYGMELTMSGAGSSLAVDSSSTAPGGFAAAVTATGNTSTLIGSTNSSFQSQQVFKVSLNGVVLDKYTNVTWLASNKLQLFTRLKEGDIIEVLGMEQIDITNMGF